MSKGGLARLPLVVPLERLEHASEEQRGDQQCQVREHTQDTRGLQVEAQHVRKVRGHL